MDSESGEITSIRIDKDGCEVCIAHGKKKKRSETTKNSMAAEYDDRPMTHVKLDKESSEGLEIGDKVKIKLAKIEADGNSSNHEDDEY